MEKTTVQEVWLVASGDLRISANQLCWPAQEEMESKLAQAASLHGITIRRAHAYDPEKAHGFIDSQRKGIEIFKGIPKNVPLIVAESVWQYSHHVLAGLYTHEGPILTLANWSGQWPGLVGMLNLNGCLTKAGVKYSTVWSKDFTDDFFNTAFAEWLRTGSVRHDISHVSRFSDTRLPEQEEVKGRDFARRFRESKAIMGVFDEGCMGMFNAIVPDHLLHRTGIFKERLSQSALFAHMQTVTDAEASAVLQWLLDKGMKFVWGEESDGDHALTRRQTLEQCKMYIAAVRIAADFGCDTIGIQYQQGLKDLTVASDLVEGLLNNRERPPVYDNQGKLLFGGEALPHFNEVDECAGIDTLITYKLWRELGMDGENTLHDIRWGEHFEGVGINDFVWTFMISGAVPPAHLKGGYQGAESWRQSPMYFRLGGGTLRGVSKAGDIVWSRIYVEDDAIHADLGTGRAVELSREETERRWKATSPEWPIMHAVLDGVDRDQLMAKHQANHIQVVYAGDRATALRACRIKAAALEELGINVHFCGRGLFDYST